MSKNKVLSMDRFIKEHHPDKYIDLFDLMRGYVDTLEKYDTMLRDFGEFDDQFQSYLIKSNFELSSLFKGMSDDLHERARKLKDIRDKFEENEAILLEKYKRGELTPIKKEGE